MTSRGWPALVIGLLAALAVGAGLVLTGGPSEARKERRDRQRDSDLSALAGLVRCLAEHDHRRLPQVLAPTPDCDWQARLQDPFTGKPYRYEVTGPRSYRLCADFELPEDRPPGLRDRDAAGCVSREYLPGRRTAPGAEATIPYRE
ncbi:hypothetical protein SAMN04488021_1297 [Paracoccus aminovorans]|uniref:Tfp pilus assembly protein PilE n=1 Tax=Paracoccus aminovorans TaxID=34004 RepID=A0A1I3C9P0_9RHOB|nr:hypothetical protein [Paracoccus aminovorans]CQR87393.1 hypothetical protein JCM7685_2851 [Paracoccus aminovorans]SFH70761.1 hypothetical protein SAMN04488021_1297 [Paracoccus aminovorans]